MVKNKLKKEFEVIISSIIKGKGLDEISSKLFALLYTSTKELTLEDLSKKTNYSKSGVCTAMKLLESTGFVQKSKKAGSKKIYFFMEKNLLKKVGEIQKKQNDIAIGPALAKLPILIEEMKKQDISKEEMEIVKGFYQNIKDMQEMNELIKMKIDEKCLKKK